MLTKSTSHVCPTCGNQLESSGDCHVCLLQLGISQAGGQEGPSSDSTLPSLEELNAQFPQLEIKRLVGRGGMGAIYHARQTALDRDVALKLIAKDVSSDAAFVERFEREAKTLAKLSHPHIVTIFDFGRTPDGIAYLIMEFVDGINLREAIASGNIGSDEALEVVSTICRALEYAHSKGVVHRDIKPENILLGEDGTLKVVDFGIAKIFDEAVRSPTLTGTRQVLGSLHYLAPEHLDAPEQVDHRVDLYALGVVFYELLTGQLPLGRYDAPSRIHKGVDQRLDAIVLKTLSRKPELRYQRAAELDSDITEIVTSSKQREIPVTSALDSQPRPNAASGKSASVPFTCEAMGGLAEAVGVVTARQGLLCVEFRIRDAIVGGLQSGTHVVEIPRQKLARLEFVPGMFGSKLTVSADSISSLGALPNAETGCVQLQIKRKDELYARQVARDLGFEEVPPKAERAAASSAPVYSLPEPDDEKRIYFALLMIMCGSLNGTGLAITETILSRELTDIPLVAATIGTGVVLGPLVLIQLLTGIANLFARPRSFSRAAALVSMLPLTPVWIISFPTGVWAYRWLSGDGSDDRQNWGTTTNWLLREARWAETAGWLHAIGGGLVLVAAAAFVFGYYPTTLRYRIVDTDQQYRVLEQALETRLQASSGFRGIDYDHIQPTYLTVKTWRRFGAEVQDLLSVQETPQLVWLASDRKLSGSAAAPTVDGTTAAEEARRAIPVVSGMDTHSLLTEEHRLGTAVCAVGSAFELSPKFVRQLSAGADDEQQLIVELSSSGREQLAAQLGAEATGGLGLVIGGLVEGIAGRESISHKQVVFQLSPTSNFTSDGIAAGIRGPNIPTQLELLD